jgi:hypothetical protein
MAFPNLVALIMQYREGIIQPIWNGGRQSLRQPPMQVCRRRARSFRSVSPVGRESGEDRWLDEQLESLKLALFLVIDNKP